MAQTADAGARNRVIAEARAALDSGQAFRASRLLLPIVPGKEVPEPEVALLAARAAAGWAHWALVVRILGGADWLDGLENGEGRALLARARVERSEDAVADARLAVSRASGEELGSRMIVLARAYDRAGMMDSAAAAYRLGSVLFPEIADWLRLRAAGVLSDSGERSAIYRGIALPAAMARTGWTEALARQRSGDLEGAARSYDGLGDRVSAARIRATSADSAERSAARESLLGILAAPRGPEEIREAISVLDDAFSPLTRDEALLVARRSAVNLPARAAAAFARVAETAALADSDQLAYGGALARINRHRQALTVLQKIRDRQLRPAAALVRGRSLLALGQKPAAQRLFREVSRDRHADSATAALAGYLAAELLVDAGDDPGARRGFQEVARHHPASTYGARAAFQAALLAFLSGNQKAAAGELVWLAERPGARLEATAALYWVGRALFALGDTAAAGDRWRTLLQRFPSSYYTLPIAARLQVPPVRPGGDESPGRPSPEAGAALDRARLLARLGLDFESRLEYERIVRRADSLPEELLPLARAMIEGGVPGRGYRLAMKRGDSTPGPLTFPLPWPELLRREAAEARVDPMLAAAIMRQESGFEPAARSSADARGLMQVLPGVAAALARAERIPDWDARLLEQPEVNLHYGMIHLAGTLARYPTLERALAAYNAGARAMRQWAALPGAANDQEVFIERIQFAETRDYVRRILRNLAVYAALYPAER